MAPPEHLYFDVSNKTDDYSNPFYDRVKQKKSSYHHMQTAMQTDGNSNDMRTRIITSPKLPKNKNSRSYSVSFLSNKNYDKKSYSKKYKKSQTRSYTMGSESTKSSSRSSSIWDLFSFSSKNTKKPVKQTSKHMLPVFEEPFDNREDYLNAKSKWNDEYDNSSIL